MSEGRAEGKCEMAKELLKNGVPGPTFASAAGVKVDVIYKWLGITTTLYNRTRLCAVIQTRV